MEEEFNLEQLFKDFLAKQSIGNITNQVTPGAETAVAGPIDLANAGGSEGFLGITDKSAKIGGLVSGLSEAIIPKQKGYNQKFLSENKDIAKTLDNEMTAKSIRSTATSAASIIPGVGPIAKIVDTIGQTVDNATKDEFGVYKSKFAGVADTILDPLGTITDLFSGGIRNKQEERRTARTKFFNSQEASKIGEERKVGNIVRNNLPQYKAPAYGKQGMKFKTKFAG